MGKITQFYNNKNWEILNTRNQAFLEKESNSLRLSFQEIKQLIDIAMDLQAWDEGELSSIWPTSYPENLKDRDLKTYIITAVKEHWVSLKNNPTNYTNFTPTSDIKSKDLNFVNISEERTILGDCPVASEKTRCCNLKTLDAVINCGFDCSYCTIQSFYKGGKILFEKNLKSKLDKLDLDPQKKYHIGTGQSSDSLMWGNRENTLKHLFNFATSNPNVILELKTKSDNIEYLLKNPIPKNVLVTWSLNPQTIIDNEEHLTASLDQRLTAAKQIHNKGALVGFHFHPMVHYVGWETGYKELVSRLLSDFDPKNVALISIGTLTFIKPVIKQIRNRNFKTKILQIPLDDAEGKLSYPYETKRDMFRELYSYFKPWHEKVFFYMCMEDKRLWLDVFNREYATNEEFEKDMIDNYFTKINY